MDLFLSAYSYIYFWHAQFCLFQDIKGNFVSHSKSFNSTFTHFNISGSEGQQQHGNRDISTHSGCRVERCVCDAQKCNQCTGTDAQREQKREKPHPVPWSGAETPLHHCDLHLFFFFASFLSGSSAQSWVSRPEPALRLGLQTSGRIRVLSGIDLVSRSMRSELRVIFWRSVSKYLFEMQR